MTLSAPLGPGGTLFWDDAGIRYFKIKVDLPSETYSSIRLFTLDVRAGDTLVVTGEVNLTTSVGRNPTTGALTGKEYPVGVGTSLWVYDASAPADIRPSTWQRLIDGTNGENVTPDMHHIQQGLTRPHVVPADWDPTHKLGVVLRVDVHSSGWDDNPTPDYVLVERHGVLMCARWRQPEPAPDDPRWSRLAALEARVTALEVPTCP